MICCKIIVFSSDYGYCHAITHHLLGHQSKLYIQSSRIFGQLAGCTVDAIFFLYYLLRPIVDVMERRKIKRSISILLIYLVIGVLLFVFSWGVWPTLRDQVTNLFENAPKLIKSLVDQLSQWRHNQSLRQVLPPGEDPLSQLSDTLNEAFRHCLIIR